MFFTKMPRVKYTARKDSPTVAGDSYAVGSFRINRVISKSEPVWLTARYQRSNV